MSEPHDNVRLRIVMAGPLPPAIGGMATVLDDMAHSSLVNQVDLVVTAVTMAMHLAIGLKKKLVMLKIKQNEIK